MGLYDNLKDVIKIVQQSDNVELLQKMLSLQAQIQETREELLQSKEKMAEKDARIRELEEKLAFKEKLVLAGPFYYEVNADGAPKGRAYCPNCWQVKRLAVHVQQDADKRSTSRCPTCSARFTAWQTDK